MKKLKDLSLALLVSFFALQPLAAFAAPGNLDADFTAAGGEGFDYASYALVLQTDGKIISGGSFSTFDGASIGYAIARLNADGSLDETFDSGTGFQNNVNALAVQSDGKVLAAGTFTSYNGTSSPRIARLNADGSLDESFDPGTGFSDASYTSVTTLALQEDGKILVGGRFDTFNGTSRSRIARLNADGSLDESFDPGTGFSVNQSGPYVLAVQSDGKVLVSGNFISFNGIDRNHIVRLNTDGSLDESFDPGTGFNSTSYTLALQSDGKVLVGGSFTSFNGTSRSRIARLNTDGSLDESFDPGTGFNGDGPYVMVVQPDGKVLVGGSFTSFNGTSRSNFARLNADGSLDESFDQGTGFGNWITALALQSDGKVIVGGGFVTYNGANVPYLARLEAYTPPEEEVPAQEDNTPPVINASIYAPLTSVSYYGSGGGGISATPSTPPAAQNSLCPLGYVCTPTTTTATLPAFTFTRDLSYRSVGADVKALQKLLNFLGFTVSISGAGSSGYETTYFGTATRAALIRLQKSAAIFPAAGYFGRITRGYVYGLGEK